MIKKGKVKIIWLHPHFLNWMGGHQYIYEVVKNLTNKHDFEVTLLASAFSNFSKQKFNEINVNTRQTLGFSTNSFLYWLFLPIFLKIELHIIKKEIRNTDIIITSMFPMNVLAVQSGKKTIQLCFEPYAFFYDNNFILGLGFAKGYFIKLMGKLYSSLDLKATTSIHKIITLSKYTHDWIKDVYSRNDAIVVYEGVDTSFYRPVEDDNLKRKYKLFSVIFHSTDFTAIKGTSYLIRALPAVVKQLKTTKLLISYTLNDNKAKGIIIALAKKLGVLDNIEFVGYISKEQLPAYYSLAKVVVQPSIAQSMSLSVKEAMACETPIITCLEGNEQTSDGKAGFLVNPFDTEKLATRIIYLLKNPMKAYKMGKEARKIILSKFSWDLVSTRFWTIIQNTIY